MAIPRKKAAKKKAAPKATKPAKRPELLSFRAYAKLTNRVVSAVSKGVKEGRIKTTKGKINPAHPHNIYEAQQAAERKAAIGPPIKGEHKSVRREPKAPGKHIKPGQNGGLPSPFATKYDAELAKIQAQITSLQIKNEQLRAQLVPRESVTRLFSQIYNVESTELLSLGDRIGPEISAICGVEDQHIIVNVGIAIRKEVERALDHIDRLIRQFIDGMETGSEDVDADE